MDWRGSGGGGGVIEVVFVTVLWARGGWTLPFLLPSLFCLGFVMVLGIRLVGGCTALCGGIMIGYTTFAGVNSVQRVQYFIFSSVE